jgi:pyruvate/2-oxoglutarate dehydrogenase complex dihydrolipoamide acyltransferase (E2) component
MHSTELNTEWRRTATAIYQKPTDSKILGSVEVDITDLELFIDEQRTKGIKITLTHFFLLATSRALKKDIPHLNAYIHRGNIKSYGTVTASLSILQSDGSMSSIKVENSDNLTLAEIVKVLNNKINAARKGTENDTTKYKQSLSKVPYPLRNWILSLFKTISITWGINLPFNGFSPNNFGSFILSNIGTLGLDIGYPALMPIANVSFVMIMGKVQQKPLVINGQILPRTVITLGAAIDHRVADASHAGILFKSLKHYVKHPHLLLDK